MSKKIHTILHSLFDKQKNNWKTDLLKNWYTILGSINTKVHLEKIYNDSLVLAVQDACWLQELYLLTPTLIKTINQSLDQPRIKSLRFKQASVKKKASPPQTFKKRKPVVSVTYTAREQRALNSIKDKPFHDALRQYLIRCYQEKE
jgi:hypothetical protein